MAYEYGENLRQFPRQRAAKRGEMFENVKFKLRMWVIPSGERVGESRGSERMCGPAEEEEWDRHRGGYERDGNSHWWGMRLKTNSFVYFIHCICTGCLLKWPPIRLVVNPIFSHLIWRHVGHCRCRAVDRWTWLSVSNLGKFGLDEIRCRRECRNISAAKSQRESSRPINYNVLFD